MTDFTDIERGACNAVVCELQRQAAEDGNPEVTAIEDSNDLFVEVNGQIDVLALIRAIKQVGI